MQIADRKWFEFRPWHQYALIFVLGALIYAPALFFKYTYFDDYSLIVQDAGYITNLKNVIKIFGTDVFRANTVAYRPFLVLSLMLDAQIGGISPWIYHLSNLLVHLAAVFLLFALLKNLAVGGGLALLLSLFILVHPALVQAVAWIPGRNDSLLGLYILGALAALVEFASGRGWFWLGLHWLLYLFALLTKEAALMFLPVGSIFLFSPLLNKLDRTRRYLLFSGWLAISACWYLLRTTVIAGRAVPGAMVLNAPFDNLQGILGYAGKMVLPANLSVIPVPEPAMIAYGSAVIVAFALVALVWGLKDRFTFFTGVAMAGAFLLPHLFRGTQFANYLEHRIYLSLLGFTLSASQLKALEMIDWRKTTAWVVASLILLAYAALSVTRLPIYYDQFSLLLNLIEKRPGLALSYQHMGYIFTESGQYNKAQLYYQKALKLEPDNKDIFHGLGVVYESKGQWQKAEESFKKGLELAPRSSSLRYNLAYLYHQRGDTAGAERQYKLAIISRPENIMAQMNLGQLYHQQGKLQQAERQYKRVLSIDGKVSQALFNLGILFRQTGRRDSSEIYLKRAVREDPELGKQMP